ncbi:YHS domain-containing (seleno)protein [Sediminibacterium roseum]|nr:YHS domain-containing (seleno)protein [Sediminibacterium roseum]
MKHLLVAIALMLSAAVHAQHQEIFATDGKAIKGYDPVAFFKSSMPMKGNDTLSYTWKDVQWLFSSKANLEAFKASPETFCPQYGGYCAYGTAAGHKSPTQTDTWTIVDGKLYFNYNNKVKEMWMKDQKTLIEKADKQWPEIKNQKP